MQGRRVLRGRLAVQMGPAGAGHPAGVGGGGGRGVGGEERPVRRLVPYAQDQGERGQRGDRGGGYGDTGLSVPVDEAGGAGRDHGGGREAGGGDGARQRVRATRSGDHDHGADAEHAHREPGEQIPGGEGAGTGDREEPGVRVAAAARRPGRARRFRWFRGLRCARRSGVEAGVVPPGQDQAVARDGQQRSVGCGGMRHALTLAARPAPGPTPAPWPFTRVCC